MYKGDRSRKETLVEYGFRLPSALDNRPLKFEEWEQLAPQMIFVSATPGNYEAAHVGAGGRAAGAAHRARSIPQVEMRPVRTQVDDVLSEINKCVELNERVLITTLTKRMAEDLTEYLHEHGVRVRYLHSDIETVERTEIIRDLRLGKFDVLVGINLLREGLDMPEVSLVAILDADKEGFLRSDNSLIQTIGRAARHINGRAILYADSDHRLDEARARRDRPPSHAADRVQHGARHHAARHHRRPSRTSWKARATCGADDRAGASRARAGGHSGATPTCARRPSSARSRSSKPRCSRRARNLEFEEAARLRDEIERLKQMELGFPSRAAG